MAVASRCIRVLLGLEENMRAQNQVSYLFGARENIALSRKRCHEAEQRLHDSHQCTLARMTDLLRNAPQQY